MGTQPPLDDAIAQIETLCAALRLTSEELVDAANVFAPGEVAGEAETVDEAALAESVDGAEEAADQAADAAAAALTALRECAAAAREGAEGPVATGQAELDKALASAEADASEWRSRVEEAGEELAASGFVPAVAALDEVEVAAQRAIGEQRAAGEALQEGATAAVIRLVQVQARVGEDLDAAIDVAATAIEAFEIARWDERWETAPDALEAAALEAGQGLGELYTDWVAAVESALSGQEEAARSSAAAMADALAGASTALEARVAECLEARQGLRSELEELAGAIEEEAAEARELAAVGDELAVALSVAAVVEAALAALKE